MQIFLPIADVPANLLVLLLLGGGVGFLSGVFGIGGGFLMTPLLIFMGIPAAVAVATEANQIAASSFSGVLAHVKRRAVDFKMGNILVAGGLFGSALGVEIFGKIKDYGQIELFVSGCYIVFLGSIGSLMFVESLSTIRKNKNPGFKNRERKKHNWIHGLPFKIRFKTSQLYISAIPPLILGFIIGILASIMGVGGGFILVPAMIYILGMPTKVVIGTSLYQIMFITAFTTFMHAVQNHTVDLLLALILIVGGVIGAQLGARATVKLKAEEIRILLAIIVLLVCLKIALDLFLVPSDMYSLIYSIQK
jgi:hypothetical protein